MKETTAERLKEVMKEQHLKQIDILEKSKVYCKKYNMKLSKTDLSQYVSGKVTPGQDKLFILSLVLNVSEAWLMGYDVPKEKPNIKNKEGADDKIMTVLKKRKDIMAIVNLLVDNEEEIDPNDVEHSLDLIEVALRLKSKKDSE